MECKNAVDKAHQPGMREIKGLGDRLFGLEQLMQETKRCVQEQRELAQAFLAVFFQLIHVCTHLLLLRIKAGGSFYISIRLRYGRNFYLKHDQYIYYTIIIS